MKTPKLILSALLLIVLLTTAFSMLGCSTNVYLLDQPVSDPIMYADDNQNSDIARCEEGGVAGGSGSCPT